MSTSRLTPDENLAILRIRQWTADRAALHTAKVTQYERHGWRERRARDADARLVRVIDFERALGQLSDEHQCLLMLQYRERHSFETIARLTSMSVRAVCYKLPAARKALASTLDRLDLL
jgi:DNA-directed RNA polymerase specialized sigma24 family protein